MMHTLFSYQCYIKNYIDKSMQFNQNVLKELKFDVIYHERRNILGVFITKIMRL